jgi:hypothetical protein
LTANLVCINIGRMDEEQIISTSDLESQDENKDTGGVNKILAGLVVILLLILVGGAAFFFGSKQNSQNPTPTPTQALNQLQGLPTTAPSPTIETTLSATTSPNPTTKATPTPTLQTMTLTSSAVLDGWRASNGGGNTTWYIQAGRNATLTERGFVSFDLSELSAENTIKEATLRLYQVETVGIPYTSLGKLMVDHLNYGTSLEASDYAVAAITSNYVTLTNNPTVEWKDAIVTEAVKSDLVEGRTKSQYRLHFETEVTGADAWARFESGDNYLSSGNLPQLVIKYY